MSAPPKRRSLRALLLRLLLQRAQAAPLGRGAHCASANSSSM